MKVFKIALMYALLFTQPDIKWEIITLPGIYNRKLIIPNYIDLCLNFA